MTSTHLASHEGGVTRGPLPVLLLFALLLIWLPARVVHADSAPVLDQSFTTPVDASVTFGAGGPGVAYVAQTFTAATTGLLTAVNLALTTWPLTNPGISLEIFGVTNGFPNNTLLTQRFLEQTDLEAMNTDPLSYNIPVPNIVVKAGTQYAIELHYYASGGAVQSVWSGAIGDHYAGGSVFTGSSYNTLTPAAAGLDLHFRTYVTTGPISDLSITRISGPGNAHACQVFRQTYRITNRGPERATHVRVGTGGGDQFEGVSPRGGRGSPDEYFDLAAGESRLIVRYFKVVAFVPGESRDGFISASIESDIYPEVAIDPDPDNNFAPSSIWLIGQPRVSCAK